MINYTFRPLRWDRESTPDWMRKSRATFKAGWTDTLHRLEYEIDHLDGDQVVIEADFRESDIRVDGMIRANARQPSHPGIKIAFRSKYGPLVYATDTYEFWQHNVRAIALALEALRSVDRYGVTKRAEQYAGWKAIGAGPATAAGSMTREQAAEFIANAQPPDDPAVGTAMITRWILAGDPRLGVWLRAAAKRLHPDAPGGSTQAFQQLQRAKATLVGGA